MLNPLHNLPLSLRNLISTDITIVTFKEMDISRGYLTYPQS